MIPLLIPPGIPLEMSTKIHSKIFLVFFSPGLLQGFLPVLILGILQEFFSFFYFAQNFFIDFPFRDTIRGSRILPGIPCGVSLEILSRVFFSKKSTGYSKKTLCCSFGNYFNIIISISPEFDQRSILTIHGCSFVIDLHWYQLH